MTTKIEWTDVSWNPVTGCTPISEGCENCYAKRTAHRLQNNPRIEKYRAGFNVQCHESELNKPYQWRKPRQIFVCSMGDLFHEDVPFSFIYSVLTVMKSTSQHTYQILTKRPERMFNVMRQFPVFNNVWLGISAENQECFNKRIEQLVKTPAVIRFVSFEPLLGPVDIRSYLSCLDWVIVGGETGPGARPMKEIWAQSILYQITHEYPRKSFFFKQMGPEKPKNRLLNGQTWEEFPNEQQ